VSARAAGSSISGYLQGHTSIGEGHQSKERTKGSIIKERIMGLFRIFLSPNYEPQPPPLFLEFMPVFSVILFAVFES